MKQGESEIGFLENYRVLDLTGASGYLAGKILADLGADVIKVEPPGGDPGRMTGPFLAGEPEPERSLHWFAYNANKRGITLDLQTPQDRGIFEELIRTADIVIESFAPGHMENLGLGFAPLQEINPGIIVVSITPFGQTGPYRDYLGSELICWAMGGLMYETGDADRSPVRISSPQAYLHACGEAAVGALMALYHRENGGEGQHVDVSVQASLATLISQSLVTWQLQQAILERNGAYRAGSLYGGRQRQVFPCRDGHVIFYVAGGGLGAKSSQAVTQWMSEEGLAPEWLRQIDWPSFDMAAVTPEMMAQLETAIGNFFLRHSRAELYREAVKRRIGLAPVNDPSEVLADPQLASRNFWTTVEHPELGRKLVYPGAFVQSSAGAIKIRQRAPLIGEHNPQIFKELKATHTASKAPSINTGAPLDKKLPLEGVKVADFGWLLAGPFSSKYLADYGATVVKIESGTRVDGTRTTSPYINDTPSVNHGGYYHWWNANKHSITLNMDSAQGLEVARKMIAWADVVVENFSVGTMEKWGLGYDRIREINPGIVMLRSSNQGQTGPNAGFAAMGIPLTGLAGFTHFTGWPDRTPSILTIAYTDVVSPRFATSAVIAALLERNRSGLGQYLDLSQLEAGLQFLAPSLLNFAANGNLDSRTGNADPSAAPHGAYHCRGENRWCAISVSDQQQWQACCRVLGDPPWTKYPAFASLKSRIANQDALNRLVESWTLSHEAEDVMRAMQAAGVPAGVVQNARDCFEDPQLRHRGTFWEIVNAEVGQFTHLGQAARLSKTPARPRMPAPLLGEHTEYICTQLLGMSDEVFIEMMQTGTFE